MNDESYLEENWEINQISYNEYTRHEIYKMYGKNIEIVNIIYKFKSGKALFF